jgi:tRNA threonylcarbamoyl adenosine modification protein YeaZ
VTDGPPTGLVLSLDGSTDVCTTALLCNPSGSAWRVAARRSEAEERAQARVLLHLVHDMLHEIGRVPADLAAIVVGTGPGTFTGVRIAVATARALALSLSVPVFGVATLAALAAEAATQAGWATTQGEDTRLLLPIVDGRRRQVFYGVYRRGAGAAPGRSTWVRTEAYGVCDRVELPAFVKDLACDLHGSILVTGDVADVLDALHDDGPSAPGTLHVWRRPATIAAEWLVRGQERLEEPGALPAGASLSPYLASAVAGRGPAVTGTDVDTEIGAVGSPESVRPLYVRPPDADIHITKMRDPWAVR